MRKAHSFARTAQQRFSIARAGGAPDIRIETRPKLSIYAGNSPAATTNNLWREARVPVALMEQRIGPSRRHGRIMTTADRLEFGARLITILAESIR